MGSPISGIIWDLDCTLADTLRDITGYDPGFPVNALGPDSEQKREMAVKAWFAWWLRKVERRFEERQVGPDLLDELIEPTE